MNLLPTPKASSAGLGGALSVIVIWVLSSIYQIEIPPEIASAITTVVAFGAAYIAPRSQPPTL